MSQSRPSPSPTFASKQHLRVGGVSLTCSSPISWPKSPMRQGEGWRAPQTAQAPSGQQEAQPPDLRPAASYCLAPTPLPGGTPPRSTRLHQAQDTQLLTSTSLSPATFIYPFYRKVRGSGSSSDLTCPRPLLQWGPGWSGSPAHCCLVWCGGLEPDAMCTGLCDP